MNRIAFGVPLAAVLAVFLLGTFACEADERRPAVDAMGGTVASPQGGSAGGDPSMGGLPTVPSHLSCGDFKVDDDEVCDDGNHDDGDGCSARCTIESTGASDVCPGEELMFENVGPRQFSTSWNGDSTDQLQHYFGTCGGSGPDRVVRIVAPEEGQLTLTVAGHYDIVLHARSGCDDASTELACVDDIAGDGPETLALHVSKGQELFVFIDGFSRSGGKYSLSATLTLVECGNGVLEPAESCEDGNHDSGDGCGPNCQLEQAAPSACPGTSLELTSDESGYAYFRLTGTNFSQRALESPNVCHGFGPDAVYQVTPDRSGSLQARLLRGGPEQTVYFRTACALASSQLACAQVNADESVPATLSIPVQKNIPVVLVVDSKSSGYPGGFELELELHGIGCPNGFVDLGEDCDDGNDTGGDGCTGCILDPDDNDACPGHALELSETTPGTYEVHRTGSTVGRIGDFQSQSFSTCALRSARDVAYSIVSPVEGSLTVNLISSFDASVSVRKLCGIEQALTKPGLTLPETQALRAQEIICVNDHVGVGSEAVTVPVEANQIYTLLVDSAYAGESGTFEFDVKIEADVCDASCSLGGAPP